MGAFVIARNPEEDSTLPYLLLLPIDGGLILKARDTWPRSSRIYCHRFEGDWPPGAEVIEETPVGLIRRRGAVIDLLLKRPRLARSQFVFTETRGRPAIFWQTQKAAKAANPGARIPRARAIPEGFQIAIDTRERYPYRFANRGITTQRAALPAGDYAILADGDAIASVERKTLENLASSLSDGSLAFQMQRLAEIPSAAVVVEARYAALFKLEHVSGAWLADMLARLQVRYPDIPIIFADSRKFAEEWTYRFLAAALAEVLASVNLSVSSDRGFRTPSGGAGTSRLRLATTSHTRPVRIWPAKVSQPLGSADAYAARNHCWRSADDSVSTSPSSLDPVSRVGSGHLRPQLRRSTRRTHPGR